MFLDVDKALREKNPKLYKRIPKFLIRWIERLIHQDEMNGFLKENIDRSSIEFATKTIDFFGVKFKAIQEENIPKTGRYIVVCNHPLGGIDGMALISAVGKQRKDIKFPVNDLLMQLTPMHEVFIPVNKHGRNTQNAAQQLNDVFASDEMILYFPAGLCSRKQNGIVRDLAWKKTIIAKAKEYQRDIIPAYFEGENSNRFYNIANWRKKLGIKVNIEMIFLPDEAFRQKGKELFVIFGRSISYQQFDQTKNEKEWAEWLKNEVYELKNELNDGKNN